MKTAYASLAAALFLTGCWGAPPNEALLKDGCNTLFAGDPEISRQLLAEGVTGGVSGFCSCYAALTVTQPEKIDLHKDVLNAINTTRAEAGIGVEAAASLIEEKMETEGAFDTFTAAQLDSVGDDFQSVAERMETAGKCPN